MTRARKEKELGKFRDIRKRSILKDELDSSEDLAYFRELNSAWERETIEILMRGRYEG